MTISTSVRGAQHPNVGRNIQHTGLQYDRVIFRKKLTHCTFKMAYSHIWFTKELFESETYWAAYDCHTMLPDGIPFYFAK